MAWINSAVMWACENEKPHVLQECINMEYDLDQPNGFFETPLMKAHFKHNSELVEMLMSALNCGNLDSYLKNAKINKKEYNMPQIFKDVHSNNIHTLKLNLQTTNQLDFNGNSALCYFAINTRIFDLLLENGARIDHHGTKGKTPLMCSVLRRNMRFFNYFLDKGADANFIDSDGNSILAYAALGGNIQMAETLIENGADVNGFKPNGKTPLSWAVVSENYAMVNFLLEKGADLNLADLSGQTPLDYAEKYKFSAIVNLLENDSENLLVEHKKSNKGEASDSSFSEESD